MLKSAEVFGQCRATDALTVFCADFGPAHGKIRRMAGSPERPVVLRRLGIVKDTDDTPFLQESRGPAKAEDALELFGSESSPRFRVGLKWVSRGIRAAGVGAVSLLRRSAAVGVLLVFAIAMVGGVWLINRLFAAPSRTETSSSEVPADESSSPAESSTTASSRAASKTPGDVVLPAGRRANAARLSSTEVLRDQQTAQTRSQSTPLLAGRAGGIAGQPDQ